MKKQMNNKIFKAMLSILVLAVMIGAIGAAMLIATAGEETPKKTLTLTWEADALNDIGECIVTYVPVDGSDEQKKTFKLDELNDTTTVSWDIPAGAKVSVKFVPHYGKLLKLNISAESDEVVESGNTYEKRNYNWSESTQTLSFSLFNYDSSVTMRTCVNRTYNIVLVNYNALGGSIEYKQSTLSDEEWQNLTGGKTTYTHDGEAITLPKVTLNGYDFQGWRVRTSTVKDEEFVDNEDMSGALTGNTINNLALGNNNYAQENGVIYIYPRMTPKVQDFYRYDYVLAPSNPNYRGAQLSNAIKGSALMADKITGLTKTDNEVELGVVDSYAGYILHVCDETCPTEKDKRHYKELTVNDSEQVINVVYRLYEPIEYHLSFLNVTDYSPASSTYTYGKTTSVTDPVRAGYTFTGWTVEVYCDGAWVEVDNDGKAINGITPTDIGFAFGDKKAEVQGGESTVIIEGQEPLTIGGTYEDPNAVYASEKNEDPEAEYSYEIRLRANWSANVYDITYDFGGVELESDLLFNATLPVEFKFDSLNADGEAKLAISNPKRAGYTFKGWKIDLLVDDAWTAIDFDGDPSNGESNVIAPDFVLETGKYAYDIRLTAIWEANTYSVALNGNGATESGTGIITEVIFDSQLILPDGFKLPEREGHTFAGFWSDVEGGEKYIDVIDGKAVAVVKPWKLYEANAEGSITLYARWIVNDYNVNVNLQLPAELLPADAEVTVQISCKGADGVWGDYVAVGAEGIDLPYGTEYRVTVTMKNGFKVVGFGLAEDAIASVAHANPFVTDEAIVPAADTVLYVVVLPTIADPTAGIVINYKTETLGGLPNGDYLLACGDTVLEISVNGSMITVNGETVSAIAIPNVCFGKNDVRLICIGDGETSADSDVILLSFAARPEEPKKDVDNINDTEQDRLTVTMKDGIDVNEFEFAVWNDDDPTLLDEARWQNSPVLAEILTDAGLEPLRPGTGYYVFIRKKATDIAPHGEVYVTMAYYTAHKNYVEDNKAKLDDLFKEYGDGPNVTELINGAKDKIDALEKGNVYVEVEKEIERVLMLIDLAKQQDDKIYALSIQLDKYLATDSYTDQKKEILQQIYQNAVDAITKETDSAKVDSIYNAAALDMANVSLDYLYDEEIKVESEKGLSSGSSISMTLQNLESINKEVIEAIRSGKISVSPSLKLTFEEAGKQLRELDVVANYNLKLINGAVENGDRLTFTLTLTDELRGYTGLRVAYYNSETGMLELLESKEYKSGDSELVFYASSIADFVILADATVNLIGVIAALGAVLLFQMIAIVALIISRVKGKKHATHACVALPTAFLAINFVPVNANLLVMIMIALAIVLQVVLMLLLLTSFAEYRGRVKKQKKVKAEKHEATDADATAAIAMTDADEVVDIAEDDEETLSSEADETEEYVDVEADAEDAFADFDEDADAVEDLEALDGAEDEADPFAVYDDTDDEEDAAYDAEEYDGEDADFIEPAPDPRYSLEDEELFAELDGEALVDGEKFVENEAISDGEDVVYAEDEELLYADDEDIIDVEEEDAKRAPAEGSDEGDVLYGYDE